MSAPEAEPSRRAGSRAEAKARTHENLLDAGLAVFADRGYGAASVEEIARRAGVSVGSVYAHFTSKEKLFLALLERRADRETALAQTELAAGFDALLPALDRRLCEEADADHLALLGAEAWLYAVRSPEFGKELAEHQARVQQVVTGLVAAERERRGVRWSLDDAEVAAVVSALHQGLVQQRRLRRGSVPDDLFGRTLTALLRGLEDRIPPA
ncbi:TetR/AcrR family transcriptional regulator [Actinomycetospora sp. TBRC 11914]|uniref:TetR/AcrR family transcriptional regulator n=1 Tax=Actinomycetospora sp. TBRC 11914 TaxID=2729387 RepID=UPI00145E2CA8|nr:TetR/AcrR family transcriptional regulator [Actinomycetospora sp. TBRC 11914]NMO91378.1 TetR/AcrR family transcriptional regulator [Actinomycetospora sp. TBRC 11914]